MFPFVLMALGSSHALAMLRCMDRLSDVVFLRWNGNFTSSDFSEKVQVLKKICSGLGLVVGPIQWDSVTVTFRNGTFVLVKWPGKAAFLDIAFFGGYVFHEAKDANDLENYIKTLSERNQ
jgi:hypothetical protein